MIKQTRAQIADKLDAAAPQLVDNPYQLLLLELILDVLVDIRDTLQPVHIKASDGNNPLVEALTND